MIKISIVLLGHFKHEVNIRLLKQWKSNIFRIETCLKQCDIPNQTASGEYWQTLLDIRLLEVLSPANDSDITLAITEYSLEDNFYMRRVSEKLVVISLFEIGDIIKSHNIPLENFILKNIYEIITLYHLYNPLPNTRDGIPDIIHDETRRCLFDMNGIKTDIIYTIVKPSLCTQCSARLSENQLPDDFIHSLKVELKKLKKPLFHRISDFIKCYPIVSIVIGLLTTILANMIANYLYNALF